MNDTLFVLLYKVKILEVVLGCSLHKIIRRKYSFMTSKLLHFTEWVSQSRFWSITTINLDPDPLGCWGIDGTTRPEVIRLRHIRCGPEVGPKATFHLCTSNLTFH